MPTKIKITIPNKQNEEPNELIIGCHSSKKDYKLWRNDELWKGNAIQIFLKSTKSYVVQPISDPEVKEFQKSILPNKTKTSNYRGYYLVVHSAYILNFAQPVKTATKELKCIVDDINNLSKIITDPIEQTKTGCVLHLGKNVSRFDQTENQAMQNMAEAVRKIIDMTPNTKVRVIIETSCHCGTEICWKIEDLNALRLMIIGSEKQQQQGEKAKQNNYQERLGFCIDTAHIWSAGYDLRTKEKATDFINLVQNTLGWENITIIHFNDSKVPFGKKRDNHDNIGEGYIGNPEKGGSLEGLKQIVKHAKKLSIPLILETPGKKDSKTAPGTLEQIEAIRKW